MDKPVNTKKRSMYFVIPLAVLNGLFIPAVTLNILNHSNFWEVVRPVDALALSAAGFGIGSGLICLFSRRWLRGD